jgi:uncharacterized protein with GYD domain
MAKYLIQGGYTPEGLTGLVNEKATGRKAALQAALKSIGGKLESFYFTLGDDDVVLIVDAPDNISVAAMSVMANATGLVSVRTTPLLTVDEMNQALSLTPKYRAPGEAK